MHNYNFIAVNFNNSSFTVEFINSIKRLGLNKQNYKIIIVDNSSEKNDFSRLETACNDSSIKLIRNDSNIGYFKALNIGLAHVKIEKSSFCIIANNDLTFDNKFIENLEGLSFDDDVLAIAPNVITPNGIHQNPHCAGRVSKVRKAIYRVYFINYYIAKAMYKLALVTGTVNTKKDNRDWKKEQFIYMGIGACYILTHNFFKYYSKLDDRVFLWGEEALLANQLVSVNGKMLYTPKIIVFHNENTSVKRIPSYKAYKIMQESYKIYSEYL